MKTLNVKLPVSVLEKYTQVDVDIMNAVFRDYLVSHKVINEKGHLIKYQYDKELDTGVKTNYSLKIEDDLHKELKLASIQNNVNMNEYAGQVIYHEVNKRFD